MMKKMMAVLVLGMLSTATFAGSSRGNDAITGFDRWVSQKSIDSQSFLDRENYYPPVEERFIGNSG
ncbi:MAG: hypothetical protein ACRC0X_09255 [Brevinema sp.]